MKDAVLLLEDGFSSKMQAEMLVLVDVLHKPASIFPKNCSFRSRAQDKRFIGKYVFKIKIYFIFASILSRVKQTKKKHKYFDLNLFIKNHWPHKILEG